MRPSIVLLVLGLLGIGWAMFHAFTGDDRCAKRCAAAGYADHHYIAPKQGSKELCSCIKPDATRIPAPR